MTKFTVAVCQMDSQDDKETNVSKALDYIGRAAESGCDLVSLPEVFTFMGEDEGKVRAAEPIPGPVTQKVSEMAAEREVYVHAGSIVEEISIDNKTKNTTIFIDNTGKIRATYSKIHMFDAMIGDEVVAEESASTVSGDELVIADTELATFGFSICYDLRFPELYSALAQRGADVFLVPSAFRLFTGKDHWTALLRARAIENHAYVIAADQIGEKVGSGHRYGKSTVIDPWGNVVRQASDREEMITVEIDTDYAEDVQRTLPSLSHKRPELYRNFLDQDPEERTNVESRL